MILNIGHRGFAGRFNDNQEIGFLKAIEQKVDMIELDIRMCGTNQLVLFHDGRLFDMLIHETPLNILQTHVMTFEELIDIYKNCSYKPKLLLDIKTSFDNNPNYSTKIVEDINKYINKGHITYDDIICSSFNTQLLKEIHQQNNKISLGFITTYIDMELKLFPSDLPLKTVSLYHQELGKDIVDKLNKLNIMVFVYTVNQKDDFKRCIDMDIDGIITDFPDRLHQFIDPTYNNIYDKFSMEDYTKLKNKSPVIVHY